MSWEQPPGSAHLPRYLLIVPPNRSHHRTTQDPLSVPQLLSHCRFEEPQVDLLMVEVLLSLEAARLLFGHQQRPSLVASLISCHVALVEIYETWVAVVLHLVALLLVVLLLLLPVVNVCKLLPLVEDLRLLLLLL